MLETQVAKMNEKDDQEKTTEEEGTICGGGQAGKEEKVTSQQEEKLIHECKICGYKCRRHCSLTQYMISQSEKLLYACHICGKTFKLRIALKYHKAIHSDVRPSEQRREEFLSPNLPVLQPKKILQHSIPTKTFCGLSALETRSNIRQHGDENQTIEKEKSSDSDEDADSAQEEQLPFECQLCHERFRTVEELNAHTHLVIKHQKCGKIITSLSDFSRHFQHNQCKAVEKEKNEDADSAHKVQIPYVCQSCCEGFCTLELLNEHSKEKHSVVCEQCGETFNTQSELNRHNRHKWCKCSREKVRKGK